MLTFPEDRSVVSSVRPSGEIAIEPLTELDAGIVKAIVLYGGSNTEIPAVL